ncbi:MAG TPA: hypothetical protein VMH81_34040 [Bryobacteraceae bacterium]|nr:hypothetical protein [Bryobacteraceae bacterium]
MRAEFARLAGEDARVGQDPFDRPDTNYFDKPDDVFVLNSLRHPTAVHKNRTRYCPFDSDPDRYRAHIGFWDVGGDTVCQSDS